MVNLWLGVAALVVIALLFIWMPFLRRSEPLSENDVDRDAQNVEIFKNRLAELERELAENNLDQTSFAALKAELEATLLGEVVPQTEQASAKDAAKNSVPIWVPLLMTVLIPLTAVFFYFQQGYSKPLAVAIERAETQMNSPMVQAATQHIQQLKQRLEANPEDPEGWFLLARTFVNLERYQEAYEAFAIVGDIVGEHPGILSQQAQALYYLNQNQLTEEAQQLLTRAQQLDPRDPSMLGFAGIVAFDHGEFQQAIGFWETALNSGKPEVNRESLMLAIEQAKSELAALGQTTDAAPTDESQTLVKAPVAAVPGFQVELSLAPELLEKVTPETTVFVVAQAVNGPPMPLAAKRMSIADLPASILLDDTAAMSPMMKLSSVPQATIKAIVSFSGSAGVSPGDLVGQTAPLSVNVDQVQTINLVINQIAE